MDHDDAVLLTDVVPTGHQKNTNWIGADVCIDAVGCEAAGSAFHTITGRKMMLQSGSAIALYWAINAVKKGGIVSIVGVYGPTGNIIFLERPTRPVV